MMTLGSLFDGIGGFPLAAAHYGVTPLWASEIEAFPIEVTKIRFPDMVHVGDITKLNGAELPSVDVICGGSPCQDLSVAGKRQGLAGERSGLFMEQVRIVKEMRDADERRNVPAHLVRPRYLVWENVPGAFSSAEGEDFRAVLEEIVRVKDGACHVPRPDAGRWESAGGILLGTEFSLAWRVLDAQYWGVAQRRRRIFLVADFGGRTAPEILFKQDCLFGNPAEGRGAGQGTAAPAKGGAVDTGGTCLTPWDVQSRRIFGENGTWPALYGGEGGGHGYIKTEEKGKEVLAFHINQREETIDLGGISGALMATANMQMQTFVKEPVLCLNDQGGERMDVTEGITATLRAGMGGNIPIVPQPFAAGAASAGMSGSTQPALFENHGIDARYTGPHEVAPTMSARYGTGGNNVPLVSREPESFCIAGNIIDRQPENGGNGFGYQEDISHTLTGMDRHAVFSRQRVEAFQPNEVTSTQSARQHKDATDLVCQPYQETVGTLCRDDGKGINSQYVTQDKCIVERRNLIRRLTPLECERLQGFPDGWTDIPGASDSARYKALGNSVAVPCVDFLLRGIAYFLRRFKDEPDM